jgi:hypothetical protein
MAETNYTRFYLREEFTALVGNIPIALFATVIGGLTLTVHPIDVRLTPQQHGVIIEWTAFPSTEDITAVDAAVAAFVGGTTTSEPFVTVNAGPITTTGAAVDVIDFTSPPLDAGTYQIIFSSQFRMTAVVVGDAARALTIVTASPAGPSTQQDHWGEAVVKAYNGAATIKRSAGQTIRVQLQIQEVGPGVGTAEMTKARVTVDKIS